MNLKPATYPILGALADHLVDQMEEYGRACYRQAIDDAIYVAAVYANLPLEAREKMKELKR